MTRKVAPPRPEQIAETVADLDRLGIPVHATIADAIAAMRLAGQRAGTSRARLAQRARQARDGVSPRIAQAGERAVLPRAFPLVAELVDGRLLGAACVGHHAWFDDRHDDEREPARAARHRVAGEICARCPVLGACRQVYAEHAGRVAGVWAGEVRTDTTQAKASR
ncbi:WhiB family transcriptional regulator [Rhodococcus opacus]|uniref:WhiB family transcriptional regulator n=1 Tax=Rhodococcus opacus TaxID=37919 RepID=UPI001F56D1EF|nr:WhiB family transcriptional regulator [Rhodococcus opacus]UNN00741.1 WhiB family transcriptional regulator [Rhodococcus opacus]